MNYSILDFGAVEGGHKLCTEAFNNCVSAVAASGGGCVIVPPGTYLTGTIVLQSNVYLKLEPGSLILGSRRYDDYTAPKRHCMWYTPYSRDRSGTECRALIYAEKAINTGIIGDGTINGQRGNKYPKTPEAGRPFLIVFAECENVRMEGVTLRDSGMFVVYSLNSNRMFYRGVTVLSHDSENGDGFDFDGGRDIFISDCLLETGDDSIGLKTLSNNIPCENFVISNCIFRSCWAGIRLGPETAADMRNITVTNCVFDHCNDGLKIQVCNDITFEDLTFCNLNMIDVVRPIFMTNNHYNMSAEAPSVRPASGKLRRVLFNGIYARMTKREGDLLFEGYNAVTGLPDAVIEDVTFKNVNIIGYGTGSEADAHRCDVPELMDFSEFYPEAPAYQGALPSSVLFIRNAANITIDSCVFETANEDKRYAIVAENTSSLRLRDTQNRNNGGLLRHGDCRGLQVESEGKVQAYTDTELLSIRSIREEAGAVNDEMLARTTAIDLSRAGRCIAAFTAPHTEECETGMYFTEDVEGTIPAIAGQRLFIYLPKICGDFILSLNGKEIARLSVPQKYRHTTIWAYELTDFLMEGQENRFHIALAEKGQAVNGVRFGFYAPVEIAAL